MTGVLRECPAERVRIIESNAKDAQRDYGYRPVAGLRISVAAPADS